MKRACAVLVTLVAFTATVDALALVENTVNFSGPQQDLDGVLVFSGSLVVTQLGAGTLPILGDFDLPIQGPVPITLNGGVPQAESRDPVSLTVDENGLPVPAGGAQVTFTSNLSVPSDVDDLHIDFLNGVPLTAVLDTVNLAIILVPSGFPHALSQDLTHSIVELSFFQTGPISLATPDAAQSEFVIPGIHRISVSSELLLAGIQVIDLGVFSEDVVGSLTGTISAGPPVGNQALLEIDGQHPIVGLDVDTVLDLAALGEPANPDEQWHLRLLCRLLQWRPDGRRPRSRPTALHFYPRYA